MARTGRPRGFSKDEAVQQAMLLFWERGYEATSLAQLKVAMGGLSSASFYAAFNSKEDLFRAVVERYLATHGQVTRPLLDPATPPRRAVEQALRASARMQSDLAHPLGCLVVLSTTTCSPGNEHLQALLATERERNRGALLACVERAIVNCELPADAIGLATVFDSFLVGLSLQARDGVRFTTLDAGIDTIMRLWDALASKNARCPELVSTASTDGKLVLSDACQSR